MFDVSLRLRPLLSILINTDVDSMNNICVNVQKTDFYHSLNLLFSNFCIAWFAMKLISPREKSEARAVQ